MKPEPNQINEIVDLTKPNVVVLSNILIKPPNAKNNYYEFAASSSTRTSETFGKSNLIIRNPPSKGIVNCKNCKSPAFLLRATKDTPEKGKYFYHCAECDYFEWAGESTTTLPTSAHRNNVLTEPTVLGLQKSDSCMSSRSSKYQQSMVKTSQRIGGESTAVTGIGNSSDTESETELNKGAQSFPKKLNGMSSISMPKRFKSVVATKKKNWMTDKRKKRNGTKKRDTKIKITKRNLKNNIFEREATLDDCESASSLSEIELDTPFHVETQFLTRTSVTSNTLFSGEGKKQMISSDKGSSILNAQATNNRDLIGQHKVKDHCDGVNVRRQSMLQNLNSVTESEKLRISLRPVVIAPKIDSVTESENETAHRTLLPPTVIAPNIDSVTESENKTAHRTSLPSTVIAPNTDSVTESENETAHRTSLPSTVIKTNTDSVTESENEIAHRTSLPPIVIAPNIESVTESENETAHRTSLPYTVIKTNTDSVTESENETAHRTSLPSTVIKTNTDSVTESENETAHRTSLPPIVIAPNIDYVEENENKTAPIIIAPDIDSFTDSDTAPFFSTIVNQNRDGAQDGSNLNNGEDALENRPAVITEIFNENDDNHNNDERQHLETEEILWELRVLNKKNEVNAVQNKKILKDMKKIREGVDRMSQVAHNSADIKRNLPNKTRERFVAWDERITTDTDFYRNMYLHLRRYRGNPKNTDYYGSVLKRIVSDNVISEYNFNGTHGKHRLENFTLVDLLYEIYEPTDRVDYEKKLKATIAFAKKRFHLKNFRDRQ